MNQIGLKWDEILPMILRCNEMMGEPGCEGTYIITAAYGVVRPWRNHEVRSRCHKTGVVRRRIHLATVLQSRHRPGRR